MTASGMEELRSRGGRWRSAVTLDRRTAAVECESRDQVQPRPRLPRASGTRGRVEACATSTTARCGGPTSTCSGHVNNVTYVDYLQEARVDMLRTPRPGQPSGELAEGVVVVRHEVTYVAPLTFGFRAGGDRVLGHRGPGRLVHDGLRDLPRGRRTSAGSTCARATVLTPYVFATERPRRLRDEERAALETFLEPAERRAAHAVGPRPGTTRSATTRCTSASPTSTSTATSTT